MVSVLRLSRLAVCGLALLAALAAGGCASGTSSSSDSSSGSSVSSGPRADTAAATLRQRIDSLLQEHVALAADATGSALAGRNDEFTAAANALDNNSRELAAAVGSVCGSDAETTLLKMWRDQVGFVVDYTQGVAAKDEARQTTAKINLNNSANDQGTYLEKLTNGRLKKEVLAELIKGHVSIMTEVIAAQQAKDYGTAYNKIRDAEHQILNVGDPLADALVDQYPDKF